MIAIDLVFDNTRKITGSVRKLSNQLYAYELTVPGKPSRRGTISHPSASEDVSLVAMVLADYVRQYGGG